jgi:multicomponent Na+:H+ antiporter subunit D
VSGWDALVPITVLLPVAAAVWIAAFRPGRRAAALVSIAAVVATCLGCAALAAVATFAAPSSIELAELVPPIGLVLRVDALGALFGLSISLLYVPATLHAVGWLGDGPRRCAFLAVFLFCVGAMLLVAFAANLVTLLVGYELFSLASVLLIVHRRTRRAFRAGVKYLVYVIPGGALALVGTVIVFFAADSVVFTPGGLDAMGEDDAMLRLAWACLVFGFGVKAALFPLHGWVPDAHPAAPPPFSAVLSGVMVATGAFAIVRVLYQIFGPVRLEALAVMPWLTVPAAIGVVVAGVLATGADELKRRLAYSTISQIGYATLAASLLHPGALTGALVHLANHAFIKAGLFFAVGAVAVHAGVHRVSELRGLGRRMPVTAALMTLLALALIGLPPLSGFIGKWLLVSGALQAGSGSALVVLLIGSVLAALYLWPLLRETWTPPPEPSPGRCERADGMLLATLLAGLLVVLFGVGAALTGFPLALARQAAQLLGGGG